MSLKYTFFLIINFRLNEYEKKNSSFFAINRSDKQKLYDKKKLYDTILRSLRTLND